MEQKYFGAISHGGLRETISHPPATHREIWRQAIMKDNAADRAGSAALCFPKTPTAQEAVPPRGDERDKAWVASPW